MKIKLNHILLILLWGALCSPFTVYGQKKKKKSKTQNQTLTQSDSLQADALFIDATSEYLRGDYDKAIIHFQKVKKSYPKESAIYHQIAKCYKSKDNTLEAIKYEGIAIELSPKNKYYYIELGEYLREIKAWNQLTECYTKMLASTSGAEVYYYDLASIHVYLYRNKKYLYPQGNIPKKDLKLLNEHFDKAINAYEQYEKYFGIDSEMILDKQDFLVLAGKTELALSEGNKLVKAYPSNSSYPLKNAKIIKQKKGTQAALNYLLDIDKNRTFNEKLSHTIISYYIQLEDFDGLTEYISYNLNNRDLTILNKTNLLQSCAKQTQNEKVLETVVRFANDLLNKYPDNKRLAYLSADIMYYQKDYANARKNYLAALAKEPDNLNSWEKIVNIDLELKNNGFLKSDLEKALEEYPKNANFNAQLGLLYFQDKDYRQSISYFQKGIKYTSRTELQVKYLGIIADAYNEIAEYDKSDSVFEEALIISPNSDLILNNYAYYLSERKEHLNKAKSMAKRLTLLYPNEPTYLDTYGWVLYQQEKYKESSIYLEKAAALSESSVIYDHYGDVLNALNRKEEAKQWWQKAADKNPDNKEEIIKKTQ